MPNPTRQFVEDTLAGYIDIGFCDVKQTFWPQHVTVDDGSSGDGGRKDLEGINGMDKARRSQIQDVSQSPRLCLSQLEHGPVDALEGY
jgi:hypothetical protein